MRLVSEVRQYEQMRDVAAEAAWEAARLIRAHAGRLEETDVEEKGVHDLVTKVDEASQALIINTILDAFPDHEVLAEEGEDGKTSQGAAAGYRWIIDPIDGTTNFTHGLPPYAVSIALQREEDIVIGVVLEVDSGALFTAIRGQGAYYNGAPMRVSRRTDLGKSLVTTGFPYRVFGHVDSYLEVLRGFLHQARGVRRFGSASVDLAYVACGRFDGFFETGLSPWDVAAGLLLVEEAGGRVTDYSNTEHPLFARQLLASNGLLHEAMLGVVRPMRDVRL